MDLINEKFMQNKLRCVLQFSIATFFVFLILLTLDVMPNAVVIASFGSSAFIAFTFPNAQVSRPRFLVGGYLVGIAAGTLAHYLSILPIIAEIPILNSLSYVFFGALAVGLAIVVMVITDTVHPPAASLALGLILHEYNSTTIIVVLVGIILLSIIKHFLKPYLKNLL